MAKIKKTIMRVGRMRKNYNPHILFVGLRNRAATLENSLAILKMLKKRKEKKRSYHMTRNSTPRYITSRT